MSSIWGWLLICVAVAVLCLYTAGCSRSSQLKQCTWRRCTIEGINLDIGWAPYYFCSHYHKDRFIIEQTWLLDTGPIRRRRMVRFHNMGENIGDL